MLFNILILLACAAIIFVHYLHGLFSGIISAILAIFAAVFALSYYEPLTERFLAGKFANTAHAMMLLMLFSVIYLVLRVIFDKAVPGNVRVPAIADKIGGALMGVIAAIAATGPVAIAGQMLPFGPNPGGYAKYPVVEKDVVFVPNSSGRQQKSAGKFDELRTDRSGVFSDDENDRQYLIMGPLSPDEVMVNLTARLSDTGSLSRRPMREFHPDLLQELFGQRLGIQTGARRVVMNNPDKAHRAFSSVELFEIPTAPPVSDFDLAAFHKVRAGQIEKMGSLKIKPNEMLLVARIMLTRDGGDPEDFMLRFSTGSVRLVGEGTSTQSNEMVPKDYHAYGFMEKGTLVATKLDDFLFVNLHEEDKGIDLAFVVERKGVTMEGAGKGGVVGHMKPGVFLELNRMGREDLGGKEIRRGLPPSDKIQVVRKGVITPPAQQNPTPAPTPVQPAAGASAKLIGAWTGTSDKGDAITLEFRAGGVLAFVTKSGPGTGSWKMLSETPTSVSVERTIGTNVMAAQITFSGDDQITYAPQQGPSMTMARRK